MQRGTTRTLPSEAPIEPGTQLGRALASEPANRRDLHPYSPYRYEHTQRKLTAEVVRDPCDPGGSGSLAAAAGREHARRRATLERHTCDATVRRVIVGFDTSQSNAATASAAAGRACALGGGGVGGTAATGGGGGGASDVAHFTLRLGDRITSLLGHSLLSAQVESYEAAAKRRFAKRGGGDGDGDEFGRASANVSVADEDVLTLTLSERFAVVPSNRLIEWGNGGDGACSHLLPLTVTNVLSMQCWCEPRAPGGVLFVLRTACQHAYVPGLRFFVSFGARSGVAHGGHGHHGGVDANGEWLEVCDVLDCLAFSAVRVNAPEPPAHAHSCVSTSAACPLAPRRFALPGDDELSDDEADTHRPGDVAPAVAFDACHFAPFAPAARGMRARRPSAFHSVSRADLCASATRCAQGCACACTCAQDGSDDDDEDDEHHHHHHHHHHHEHEHEHHEHGHGCCACYPFPQADTFVYVPPPTTPGDLAGYVRHLLRAERAAAVERAHDDDGGAAAAQASRCTLSRLPADVRYDADTDMYAVKSATNHTVTLRRLLLGNARGDVSVLNFPLSRKRAAAVEGDAAAKQRLLRRTLDGFHFFTVSAAARNDRFRVRFDGVQRTCVVRVPDGVYTGAQLAAALGDALNEAARRVIDEPAAAGDVCAALYGGGGDDERPPLFAARYSVLSTDALRRLRAAWLAAPAETYAAGAAALDALVAEAASATCANEPYDAQSFVFSVSSPRGVLFSLLFGDDDDDDDDDDDVADERECAPKPEKRDAAESAAFAALIDFAPRNYELSAGYVGRALSDLCDGGGQYATTMLDIVQRGACASACAPTPRRRYTAQVDAACGLVTLQQRVAHPQRFAIERAGGGGVRLALCTGVDEDAPAAHCCRVSGAPRTHTFVVGDAVIASATPPQALVPHARAALAIVVDVPSPHSVVLNTAGNVCAGSVYVTPMPVGFNVHLHSTVPPPPPPSHARPSSSTTSTRAAQSSALQRWLGFVTPHTRSGCRTYTSDRAPASIIDEQLLLAIPELCTLGLSEARPSFFTQTSPFQNELFEYYQKLVLDHSTGTYRFGFPGVLGSGDYAAQVLARPGGTAQACPTSISVQLLRPDGTPYYTGGYPLVFDLELAYC